MNNMVQLIKNNIGMALLRDRIKIKDVTSSDPVIY